MIHSAQSRDYRNHVVKFCNRNFSAILRNLKQFSGCCRKGPRSCDCQFWLFFVSCAHLIPILRCVLTHKFFLLWICRFKLIALKITFVFRVLLYYKFKKVIFCCVAIHTYCRSNASGTSFYMWSLFVQHGLLFNIDIHIEICKF